MVAAAGLPVPVEEVRFVLGAEHDLVERFAVDDARDVALPEVLVAVDEPAGVARRPREDREPDESVAGVTREVVEGTQFAVVGEHLVLVEPPATEPDGDLAHTRA